MRKIAVILVFAFIVALFAPVAANVSALDDDGIAVDFEDGTTMGFQGRDGEAATGEKLTVTNEISNSGSYSLLVSNRSKAWHGPSLNVTEHVEPGIPYNISVWIHAKTPQLSNFKLSTQIGEGSAASYHNLSQKIISTEDEWVEIKGRYTYPESDYITIYIENDTVDAEFYIDDVIFSQSEGTGFRFDNTLPSLAEVYKDDFLIGNAFSNRDLTGQRFDFIKHHFNVLTAENAMKPDALSSAKGEYDFDGVDEMLGRLEAVGIPVVGHTLVWHSQSPDWLNKDKNGDVLTRAQAKANMEEFISTVAGHFAGRIISWDVVNEAFEVYFDHVPSNWRDMLRKGGSSIESSAWFGAYENGADKDAGESGADYIYDAFVFTRLADPNAVLYYNDFNETYAGKREAIARMTTELNEQWKNDPRNTEPNRLLIEGLGMQAHYWLDTIDPKDVEDTIIRWSETGAELSITELDLPLGNYDGYKTINDQEERTQAYRYARIFRVFKEHADKIERVTIWGIDDESSWRREGSPLLFRDDGSPKLAFFAAADPQGFMDGLYFDDAPEPVPDEEPDIDVEPHPMPTPDVQEPELPENNTQASPPDIMMIIALIAIGAAVIMITFLIVTIVKRRKK